MRKAAQARAISLNQPILDPSRRPEEQTAKEGNEGTNSIATSQGQGPNAAAPSVQNGQTPADAAAAVAASFPRQASELVDEVLQVLKTTFPLLILSLETMVDQIHQKFKPPPEEDIYRHICLLLSEAIQVRPHFVLKIHTAKFHPLELYTPNECT
jgi:transformation/transcription domain-associated protein